MYICIFTGQADEHGMFQTKVGTLRARRLSHRLPVVCVLQRESRQRGRECERRGPDQQTEIANRKSHVGGAGIV